VQEKVDGEEVIDPDNTSSVLRTVLHTIINEFEYKCLEKAVGLLKAHLISQSTDDHVTGQKCSIRGLPGMKYLAHQFWAIWCIVRRWVWDANIAGALVADEMGLRKTFTFVAAAIIRTLLTGTGVIGVLLSILWGNTLVEWVNMVPNDIPGIIGEEQERYPLRRHHSVPRHLIEIQETPRKGHPAPTSALQLILVVIMPGVAECLQ